MRPFLVGLTGSIGMGKSTAAGLFRARNIPVWDADAAVHALYAPGGAGVEAIRAMRPDAIAGGAVDRKKLSDWIAGDPGALPRIERAIHPLVAEDRARFVESCEADIAVLDIPLLFETGAEGGFDLVAVVSAPAEVQRDRVLSRPGMTEERLDAVLARQVPDAEKRARGDVVIPSLNLEETRATIDALIHDIRGGRHARNRP
ncbi:dephospho-CoA kinase [Palleronia sp. LCG004]|uniref:dephospho-CoA kinase n=1 Tax=Palleronia sp. LCG004 TaxID=3079304 RepID=UPI0029434059|nr:dephospho-CoA kinase [Palleronia sp. LCG004]WOI55937.1 dephospho-CoA kinase [Palleronia sp. LCG004]